jgi:hypothetical protein
MDIGSWITQDNINTLVAGSALVVGAGAWRAGHRSANATEASAEAAQSSAAEAKRSADAAFEGVRVANASLALQQESVRPKPQLRIDRVGNGLWRLINGGMAAAENIAIHEDDATSVFWDEPLGERLAPGESRDLSVVAVASPPSFLRFVWDGQPEPHHVQCPGQV